MRIRAIFSFEFRAGSHLGLMTFHGCSRSRPGCLFLLYYNYYTFKRVKYKRTVVVQSKRVSKLALWRCANSQHTDGISIHTLPNEEKPPERRSGCDLFENVDRTLHLRAQRFFALRICYRFFALSTSLNGNCCSDSRCSWNCCAFCRSKS